MSEALESSEADLLSALRGQTARARFEFYPGARSSINSAVLFELPVRDLLSTA